MKMPVTVDVIVADNTRPACGGPFLIRYAAAGVHQCLNKGGFAARWVEHGGEDTSPSHEVFGSILCYAVFFGNKSKAFRHMQQMRQSNQFAGCIIAFGLFAAAFPELILRRGLADIVVLSDPEFVIPQIVAKGTDAATLLTIPKLAYCHNGQVVYSPQATFDILDDIPFVGPFLYHQGDRPALMLSARGCQYHCVFCDRNALWGGGVRHRNVENVIAEIETLVVDHNVKEIRFIDEDLAADRGRLAKICDGIRRIKRDFYWQCSACIDSVNEPLLMLMGRSKCRTVNFGVESASSHVLRRIGKHYGTLEILNAIRWAKQAQLRVEVMLTTGNPGETIDDERTTLAFLNRISPHVDDMITNRLVILPGTPLYRQALKEGRFTPESFFEDEGLVFYNDR